MQLGQNTEVEQVADVLKRGGIVVVRTDTLYGIIARAENRGAVARVYKAKKRNPAKQCIILLSRNARTDNARLTQYEQLIQEYSNTKQPTSVIVPSSIEPSWLLSGEGDSVAYRFVNNAFLQAVIEIAGPVIAPSANLEGEPPARSIQAAREYFGRSVDYYVDGGEVPADVQASQIIKVNSDGTVETLRSA